MATTIRWFFVGASVQWQITSTSSSFIIVLCKLVYEERDRSTGFDEDDEYKMMIVVERNDVHFTKLPVIVSVTLLILSENILSIDNYASFSSLQLYEWSDVGKACNCIQFIFPRFHSGLVPINSDTFPLYGHFQRRLQFKVTKCDQTRADL